MGTSPHDGAGQDAYVRREEREPVDCSACDGTGLTHPRVHDADTDPRCPICDGYGVLPKPELDDRR
jgi:DnaJ-class molecular chaperone